MHKTKCWHKVTQRAKQGLVGRQEESFPLSLHLSIDIPGSLSSASGFCNYNQTAASRPQSTDWRLGLSEMWRGLGMLCVCVCVCLPVSQSSCPSMCVYYIALYVRHVSVSALMCEFLCLFLFLSISWFCLYICVCTALMCPAGLCVWMTRKPYVWSSALALKRVWITMQLGISIKSHCVDHFCCWLDLENVSSTDYSWERTWLQRLIDFYVISAAF